MYPGFGWYYAVVGLIFQAALLVFAIRTYRATRTRTTLLMMWAIICYVITASSWYTFHFSLGLVLGAHPTAQARRAVANWRFYSDQTFEMVFAALMIAALVFFARGASRDGTQNI
jgi:hypothetical protein